jgi:hypothetical protein
MTLGIPDTIAAMSLWNYGVAADPHRGLTKIAAGFLRQRYRVDGAPLFFGRRLQDAKDFFGPGATPRSGSTAELYKKVSTDRA